MKNLLFQKKKLPQVNKQNANGILNVAASYERRARALAPEALPRAFQCFNFEATFRKAHSSWLAARSFFTSSSMITG